MYLTVLFCFVSYYAIFYFNSLVAWLMQSIAEGLWFIVSLAESETTDKSNQL